MNLKLTKWFLPILVAILGILTFVSPVLASIPQPTDLDIQEVAAYENTKEDGDQLYLITYFIDFTVLPDENADDLFIFRLLDEDDNEITSTKPYAFYNQGYELGVVAFYLEPDDAPTWGSSLSIQIAGNPLADWTGDPPITTTGGIGWNTGNMEDIQKLTSAKIIYLASELEQVWEVEMVVVSGGTTILSDTGSLYFLRVVPYLRDVAPYVLGQYTFTPSYPAEKPTEDSYSTELEQGIIGTLFDLSIPAQSLGISRGALTASIYYAFVVAFFLLLLNKRKFNKGTMMLLWPFVIAGHFFGVPLIVTILGGFLCLVSTVWVFYKGTA